MDLVVSKACRMVGFIKRASTKFQVSTILYLFHALGLPILTYSTVIWSPFTQYGIHKLESSRHLILHFVSFKLSMPMSFCDHDYSDVSLVLAYTSSVCSLHSYSNAVYGFKILNGLLQSPELPVFRQREVSYTLRLGRQFHEIQARTNFDFDSARCRMIRLLNLLPSELLECSNHGSFKHMGRFHAQKY